MPHALRTRVLNAFGAIAIVLRRRHRIDAQDARCACLEPPHGTMWRHGGTCSGAGENSAHVRDRVFRQPSRYPVHASYRPMESGDAVDDRMDSAPLAEVSGVKEG